LDNSRSVPSSTFSPLPCSALSSLCPTPPPPSSAMCQALTAPRRPSVHHMPLLHSAVAHPTALATPPLAAPHYHPPEPPSAAARHRCSPTGATSCFWQSPSVTPRSTATLVLPAVFSRMRHAAPPLSELRSRPPRSPPAASTSYRSLCPLFNSKHILELPIHFFLRPRTHISTAISFPDHRASPDLLRSFCSPSTAAHAASHPRSSAQIASPSPTGAP
jgi:hypothetical protein